MNKGTAVRGNGRGPRAALFVIGAGAAFASSGPLARYARPAHPLLISAGRLALAALILGAADPRGTLAALGAVVRARRAGILGVGLLLAVHFGLFLYGLDATSLPSAVALISLQPLSVIIWAWLLHRARPSHLEQLGVGVATLGGLIIARGAGAGEHRLAGDLMVLAAVAVYGWYVNASRLFRDFIPARPYAALVYGSAALVSFLALVWLPARAGERAWPLEAHSAWAIVGLALLPTLVGHTAVQMAARSLPPSIVALVSPAETVGAMLVGAVWLGLVPTGIELAGALVIIAGATVAIFGAGGRSVVT